MLRIMLILCSAVKRAKSKWSASKFGRVVEEAGLLLGVGDQENLLSKLYCSHSGFQ